MYVLEPYKVSYLIPCRKARRSGFSFLEFNVFFPDTSFSLDTARSALASAVRADPALADLAAMGAGVSTDGMRVAGVPVGVDAWVKTFVAKKAQSVIIDVAKLDVV